VKFTFYRLIVEINAFFIIGLCPMGMIIFIADPGFCGPA
jgi:hypothetical protein